MYFYCQFKALRLEGDTLLSSLAAEIQHYEKVSVKLTSACSVEKLKSYFGKGSNHNQTAAGQHGVRLR